MDIAQIIFCRFLKAVLLACLFLASIASNAELQKFGMWDELVINGDLSSDQKWLYWLNGQLRFLNQPSYFQTGVVQGGVGYQLLSNLSLWNGYFGETHNSITGAGQQNRIWQQALWDIFHNDQIAIVSRARFEERQRMGESQWAYRFRDRLTLRFPKKILDKYTPAFWDEMFFNINKPQWVVNRTFEQNRIFAGIDIPVSKKNFLEVGYLNQYLFRNSENQMNHLLYIGLYLDV